MATGSQFISALLGKSGRAPELSPRILERKIAFMYARQPTGLAMGLVVALALTFLLPSPEGRGVLLAWGLANVLLATARFADCLSFGGTPLDPAAVYRRRARLMLGAAAQGTLYGLLCWFRFPQAPLDQLLLTLIVTGMAGGGIIFLSPIHIAYVLYLVPLMVPDCVRLLTGGMAMQELIGGLGLIYVIAMLLASAKTCRWMEDALGSSFENEDLVGQLKTANAGLEEHKARLEQVVEERTRRLSAAVAQLREGLREKEQERLRAAQSDANHLSLLQAINEGFGHVDEQEVFLFANPAAEKIFGVPPGTLVGRSLLAFLDPAGAEMVRQETGTRREGRSNRYLCPIILDDGQRRLLEVNASPIHDLEGRFLGSSAVFEDITERKQASEALRKLEAELHHAQKLESIGSLAGGVAHDMNNILGAVQAIVQALVQKHAGEAGLVAELGIIERASTRGRDLVKSLTNFVRKGLEEPEALDLNGLVREEAELLGRTAAPGVAVVVDLEEPLPVVMGERGALGSALMNLCVNAMDAMPEQGTLTLRTRLLPDGQIGLSLEDTGKGMAPEVLARAMEPFFTTKAIGKGTGLGLAMVYATVKAHGGSVSLRSEVGLGTTVLVRLPAAAGSAPAPGTAVKAEAGGALRILQVDDDDLILESIPMLLRLQGHAVTTAAGGLEALDRLRAGLEVDLVILDLNMPGLNGMETLELLRELRPELPVLLATGYLDPGNEARLKTFGNAMSIAKPFSIADLDGMLRKIVPFRPGIALEDRP